MSNKIPGIVKTALLALLVAGCGNDASAPEGSEIVVSTDGTNFARASGANGVCDFAAWPPVETNVIYMDISVVKDGRVVPGIDVSISVPWSEATTDPTSAHYLGLYDDEVPATVDNGTVYTGVAPAITLDAAEYVSAAGMATPYEFNTGGTGTKRLWIAMKFDADCAYSGDVILSSGAVTQTTEIVFN